LRKLVISALAALTALAVATVALAQNPAPAPTLTAKLAPSKAGTKKKPKNTKFTFDVKNNRESQATASQIELSLPKGMRINGKGLPSCPLAKLAAGGPSGCPSGSKAGSGTADAFLVTPPPQTELHFTTQFFVGGTNSMTIFLQQTGGTVTKALEGKLSNGGRKMTIAIPSDLQQPAPGLYSALESLQGTISAKKGKNYFVALTSCPKSKKLKISAELTFAPNPNPPSASTAETSVQVPCRK
jgi:hypothetical protein